MVEQATIAAAVTATTKAEAGNESDSKMPSTSNDEAERRGAAPTVNEADGSRSSTSSLDERRRGPVIARTDCYACSGYRVTWHSTALSLTLTQPVPDRAN
jgi:hypothetical protein